MRPGGGEPDTPGWTSRVVPNLYPALADPSRGSLITQGVMRNLAMRRNEPSATGSEAGAFASSGDPLLESRRAGEPDLFASRPAVGGHEVIVNAPEHVTAMAELSEERFLGAIATWRERMRAHADAAYVQLVVNEGAGPEPRCPTRTPSSTRCPSCRRRSLASASGPAPTANAPPAEACSATSWSRRCVAASAWSRSTTRRR